MTGMLMPFLFLGLGACHLMPKFSSPFYSPNLVTYTCENHQKLQIEYTSPGIAKVTLPTQEVIVLSQVSAASGFHYVKSPYHLEGKGNEVRWWRDNREASLVCYTSSTPIQ